MRMIFGRPFPALMAALVSSPISLSPVSWCACVCVLRKILCTNESMKSMHGCARRDTGHWYNRHHHPPRFTTHGSAYVGRASPAWRSAPAPLRVRWHPRPQSCCQLSVGVSARAHVCYERINQRAHAWTRTELPDRGNPSYTSSSHPRTHQCPAISAS